MSERKRIGLLTSGGDCPGLNAVMRAVVFAANQKGWDVVEKNDKYWGVNRLVRKI